GRHAPLSELTPAGQLLELVPGDLLQPSLPPLPERDGRPGNVGDDRERVEVELSSHEGRGEVLVHDRFHSLEDAVRAPDDGDPPAARDDGDPARPEAAPAPAGTVERHRPSEPLPEGPGLLLRVVPADGLRRPAERRVTGRDLGSADDGEDRTIDPDLPESRRELGLDEIADLPLGLRAQDVHRAGRHLGRGELGLPEQRPHLGSVAVREYEFVTRPGDVRQNPCGGPQSKPGGLPGVVSAGALERVPSERDQDSRHGPDDVNPAATSRARRGGPAARPAWRTTEFTRWMALDARTGRPRQHR